MVVIINWMCYSECYVHVVNMAADASKAEVEISQLKDMFKQDCHVICNVGDFSHVVSISFNEWNVNLKFQIPGISLCQRHSSFCQYLYLSQCCTVKNYCISVHIDKFHFSV